MYKSIPNLIKAKPVGNFSLDLVFDDGTEGKVDLSNIKRRGFFEIWNTNFNKFKVEGNILSWSEDCEIDADSLYLKLINKDFFEYAGD